MEKAVEERMSGGTAALDEALEYSYASLEYAGLVLISYIKRGGTTVLAPLEKVAYPAWSKIGAMYGWTVKGLRQNIKKVIDCRGDVVELQERLDAIEKRLQDIESSLATREAIERFEQRLAYLEKHGIMATREGGLQVKGKKLTEDRLMLLRTIVKENIDLMEGE